MTTLDPAQTAALYRAANERKLGEYVAGLLGDVERDRDEAVAARDSHFEARNMLGQKVDALEATLAEVRRTSRYLPCDGLCRDYPEENCSLHGREPAELWEAIVTKNERAEAAERELAEARGRLAAVEALRDEWDQQAERHIASGIVAPVAPIRSFATRLRATLTPDADA